MARVAAAPSDFVTQRERRNFWLARSHMLLPFFCSPIFLCKAASGGGGGDPIEVAESLSQSISLEIATQLYSHTKSLRRRRPRPLRLRFIAMEGRDG